MSSFSISNDKIFEKVKPESVSKLDEGSMSSHNSGYDSDENVSKSSETLSLNTQNQEGFDDVESNPVFIRALIGLSKKYDHNWKKISKKLQHIVQKNVTPI